MSIEYQELADYIRVTARNMRELATKMEAMYTNNRAQHIKLFARAMSINSEAYLMDLFAKEIEKETT